MKSGVFVSCLACAQSYLRAGLKAHITKVHRPTMGQYVTTHSLQAAYSLNKMSSSATPFSERGLQGFLHFS